MILVLVIALLLFWAAMGWGAGGPPDPPIEQRVGVRMIPCADGSIVEVTSYDPDPDDPVALIQRYRRAGTRLGFYDARLRHLYVDALKAYVSLAEVRQRGWASPCDLPDPGPKARG